MRQPLDFKTLNTVAARCFLPSQRLDTLRIFLYNASRIKLFSAAGSGKVNGEFVITNYEFPCGRRAKNEHRTQNTEHRTQNTERLLSERTRVKRLPLNLFRYAEERK